MRIKLMNPRDQARGLGRWCLDHPPQTVLSLMVFVMISSYLNFWLAWFALACFLIGSIGLICMMFHDIVRNERAQRDRWQKRNDVQRVAMRRMQEKLTALRSGRDAAACPPSQTQSDQDEA